jgi:hypothetical protein
MLAQPQQRLCQPMQTMHIIQTSMQTAERKIKPLESHRVKGKKQTSS